MLRSVIFAAVVALAVASPMGPSGRTGSGPHDDMSEALSGHAAEALERMAREVVGEGREEECDNENEKYKWFPPLPCRVENSSFATLASRQCPDDGQCNVGPVDTTMNATAVRVFFCSRPGKYMLYQACRVQNADTGEDEQASQCGAYDGEPVGCNVGPFSVLSNKTNYIAYYCDTTMTDSREKVAARGVVSQACRVENQDGDDMLRRRCPAGFRCTKGPMEGEMHDMEVKAYMCEEEEMEWEWTLSETVTYLVVEKQVDPFDILMVMRLMQDRGVNITARAVYQLVSEHVKEQMEEQMKQKKEQEKENKKESVEDIMHMLEHRRLINMQAELRRKMYEEKQMDKEGSVEELMHMLHHVSLVAMEAKMAGREENAGAMAELVKGMMGQKKEKEEEDMGLNDLLKHMMGQKKEKEEEDMGLDDLLKYMLGEKKEEKSEEMKLKMMLKKLSFVKTIVEMVMEVEEKDCDDEAKMLMVLKRVHETLEEYKEVMEGVKGEAKVVKVMKAIMYVKGKFEGAEEEMDEDVKWMVIMAKHILMKKKEEEEKDNPLKELMEMLKGKKEEKEEDNPLKELMEMMMGKKEKKEENSLEDLLKMMMGGKKEKKEENSLEDLLKMMMGKKQEEEEDKNPLMMLMKMMQMKKEKDDDERDPMKMLLAQLMGGRRDDDDEEESMLRTIMEHIKELQGKKQDEDNEAAQIMMFVKAMMGGEGSVQDVVHYLHHAQLIKMEQELRQKHEEMAQQRESENKAQELLRYMHSAMQQRGGMGNYGPPMAGMW